MGLLMMQVISRNELPRKVWQITELMEGLREPRDKVERNFIKYHKDNPIVFSLFDRFCHDVISLGYNEYSPWFIMNRVRWETDVVIRDSATQFKISNDYISLYSRWWMEKNPKHLDWFETNIRKSEQMILDQIGAMIESRAKSRKNDNCY